jgi:predicted nucleic acid-binding protein
MKYLLDVNALIALGFNEHMFTVRVSTWAEFLISQQVPEFATTPVTELGFVRILSQAYRTDVDDARELLHELKNVSEINFSFIPDDHGVSHLPAWVKTAKHTTDGHLAQLAVSNGAVLATLDENIPDSFLIPVG